MRQAVLLLAHGAPERLEDIPAYLQLVRGGRPTSPEIVEEVRHRYEAIGGASPLAARTREQAAALERQLATRGCAAPVYVGMRNWLPSIAETVQQMKRDGIQQAVAICLAPQYSKSSVGLYFRRLQEARQQHGWDAGIVWTKSFHDHPGLTSAFLERLRPLLPADRVLLTAHSLPVRFLEGADPYDSEARTTARLVAEAAGLAAGQWDFAYQSQGFTGDEWLGPTVESVLERYAGQGVRGVVLQPIGFVCDHVEILYDVDVAFRDFARERGIALRRPESLNDSPAFAAALADVASRKLCA